MSVFAYTENMKQLKNTNLSSFTSLRVGGPAKKLVLVDSSRELLDVLEHDNSCQHVLGFGCNILVSDQGLPGTTVVVRGGDVEVEDTLIVADTGVWWDNVVLTAAQHSLWGLELMSEIPSSVGGAVFGNIAAYGVQISDVLEWVDVYNRKSHVVTRLAAKEIAFSYRHSSLQDQPDDVILRAAFRLSQTPLHALTYDSAIAIGEELGLSLDSLGERRKIIVETRRRAGSIYHFDDPHAERSAGSFFKNPLVSTEQARFLASFDETGKTLERVEHQSKVHGGDSHRASAAHVLLAAGFSRGQRWGQVQLHDRHVLKIITHDGATASDVYAVVQEILTTVHNKLDITLETEVKFLGF